jgi:N4-bis(aminopropyl)spermidine synthase
VTGTGTAGGRSADDGLEAAAEVVAGFGVGKRRLREAMAMLTDGRQSIESLVRGCALPRRIVESLVRAADPDLDHGEGGFVIRPDRLAAYRDRFAVDQLRRDLIADPYEARLAAHGALVAQAEVDIAAAPAARDGLDHVAATAQTVARRALWLNATFDLAGSRLLCIGDHDLSSLAICALVPGLAVTVLDADERLLDFIGDRAVRRGYDLQCLYADFRFGIPDLVAGSADVVLTDPPYTPEGVQLFLGRGVQGLRDHANGRLVMAYGFSSLHPALGMKVQRAVQDLDLVTEAILPVFNRYHGAQAVGSASDLYVLRPTSRTFQILDARLAGAAVHIYTRGVQSLEGRSDPLEPEVAGAVIARATGAEDRSPSLVAGDGWPATPDETAAIGLGPLLTSVIPAAAGRRGPLEVVVNLAGDPGPWLLRVLAAVNADRLAVLVPNAHQDLANQEAQHALTGLVAPKYSLRLRRSSPAPSYAIVEATAVGSEHGSAPIAHDLLCRAHGKVGNVWREALIRHSAPGPGGPLTKNEARALIAAAAAAAAQPGWWLDARLIDLPRHAIQRVLDTAEASVKGVSLPVRLRPAETLESPVGADPGPWRVPGSGSAALIAALASGERGPIR